MRNLVRGGAILLLTSLFVAFIYAQTGTDSTLAIANYSQEKQKDTISDSNFYNQDNDNKLVKTTASVRAKSARASRGSFSATAYCLSGKTAMGHRVRRGIIAADPRVLRLGSTITINAGAWSGTYLVSDTGGGIKGKRLDIWVPNCSEARRFGRRSVEVFAVQ